MPGLEGTQGYLVTPGFEATGGGDYPEDVDAALQLAVDEMNWSDTGARLVFLIGDAPPKNYGVDRDALLERARRAEITFHTVQARHLCVHNNYVWAQGIGFLYRLQTVSGFPDQFHV